MVQESYSIDIKCRNCKRQNWITKIPIGKEVNDYLEEESIRCRVCNCLLFNPKPPKEEKDNKKKDLKGGSK